MTTLTAAFAEASARYRDRTALIDGTGQSHRFSDVQNLARSYAAAWHAKGVRQGDRVLIAMGIGVELYAALAALWSLGATVVLPEPAMGLKGVQTAVAQTQPKYFCAAGSYRWVKWLVPALWGAKLLTPMAASNDTPPDPVADPQAVALISFTSGTTGVPKAIPRTHAFLMAQWQAVGPLLQSDRDEIDLVTFPVFVLINLAEGRTSVLPNWKMSKLGTLAPNALVSWIKQTQATRALLPPALCEKLVTAQDCGTLTRVFTGGGPVFPDVVQGLTALSTDLQVTTVYGSTEAEPIAHAHGKTPDGYGLCVGRPFDAVRLRIVNDEIQVAGDHVNKGYLEQARDVETKVREDGEIWHRTGDAGRLDDAGVLWLLGRVGDEVQTEQGPLHPFAIEVAARRWPGVRRAALMTNGHAPVLVIEGLAKDAGVWKEKATAFGVKQVVTVDRIPLDRRHHSKVDRNALRTLLQKKL
ncbi:Acyl-CoA synthetase (AMP-forming)/AMP-acid ligase II [Cognatiyoonia koreensis]|uniref:Acyl-CoA synthetase (AMP-forming)/AMP-acid ligase II n=1 Tax=Cognatiyoonia koreensis TaxID=364200 RepID=A0A1I0PVS1_9RHOB|nr:AMP-binding protein [Cognatiyoonia koreensis]SEW18540.1 Acyl-CoA synthetase (AMP-forming)/AMP-acid ligase II [Cognatiyoonia koreensis]